MAVELRLTELMIVVREREGRLEGGLGFRLVERRILGFRVLDILAINMFKRVRCRSRLLRVLWSLWLILWVKSLGTVRWVGSFGIS